MVACLDPLGGPAGRLHNAQAGQASWLEGVGERQWSVAGDSLHGGEGVGERLWPGVGSHPV